jgi:DnaK suppressor protein
MAIKETTKTNRKTTKKSTPKKTAKKLVTKKRPIKKHTAAKKLTKQTYQGEEAFLATIEPYKLNKKEKYMSAKQKKHFLKILERWKQLLQLEQSRTADKIQNNSNHFADESDRATHEEGFTLEIKTRERERKLLSKIDQSIKDLSNQEYGFCENPNCGVEIGIRRLEARPTACLCIDCKTLEEITEKQQYG